MHLGHMAERLRRGFYGDIDWAIIEVSAIEMAGDKIHIFLTSADGIVPTIVRLAKRVILELNMFHDPRVRYLHDEYECEEYPNRRPIPLLSVGGRIGKEYLELDPSKLVGVVECCIPEEARSFKGLTPETEAIGNNVVDFFLSDIKKGHIPPNNVPYTEWCGSYWQCVMKAIGQNAQLPKLEVFSEVVQDAIIDMMLEDKIAHASVAAMTVSNECLKKVYDNIDYFSRASHYAQAS